MISEFWDLRQFLKNQLIEPQNIPTGLKTSWSENTHYDAISEQGVICERDSASFVRFV